MKIKGFTTQEDQIKSLGTRGLHCRMDFFVVEAGAIVLVRLASNTALGSPRQRRTVLLWPALMWELSHFTK